MSVCVSVKSVMSVCECDECEERMSDGDLHVLREKRFASIIQRVGKKMRWKMGESLWREFVNYSREKWFPLFCSLVLPDPVLNCVGCPTHCPRNFCVTNKYEASYFHCDHVFIVAHVLQHWHDILPDNPTSPFQNTDKQTICAMLFLFVSLRCASCHAQTHNHPFHPLLYREDLQSSIEALV